MSARPIRRRFQLGLRSLFLLTLVVAVFCAGYSLGERNAQREEEARKQLRQLGLGAHLYSGVNLALPSAASGALGESSSEPLTK
jgi:hypothetical protein